MGTCLRVAAPHSAVASSESVTQEFLRSQHRARASWLSLTSCSAGTVPAGGLAKGLPKLTSSSQLNVLPQAFSREALSTDDLCPEPVHSAQEKYTAALIPFCQRESLPVLGQSASNRSGLATLPRRGKWRQWDSRVGLKRTGMA